MLAEPELVALLQRHLQHSVRTIDQQGVSVEQICRGGNRRIGLRQTCDVLNAFCCYVFPQSGEQRGVAGVASIFQQVLEHLFRSLLVFELVVVPPATLPVNQPTTTLCRSNMSESRAV